MVNIRVRAARSGDWNKLETLIAGLCRYHGDQHKLTRTQFDNMTMGENAPVIVMVAETEDGILAGFVAGFFLYRFQEGLVAFEIQNLFVAETFRRNRIGEVLMISVMREARRRNDVGAFALGALNWNEAALEFYKQLGFEPNLRAADSVRLVRRTA